MGLTGGNTLRLGARLAMAGLSLFVAVFVATWTIGHSVVEFTNPIGVLRLLPAGWPVTPEPLVSLRAGLFVSAALAPILLAVLCTWSPSSPKVESTLWIGIAVVSGVVYGAMLTPRISNVAAGVLIAILVWSGALVYLWALRSRQLLWGGVAAALVLTAGILWGFVFAVPIATSEDHSCDGFSRVHEELSVAREFGVAPRLERQRYISLIQGAKWPGDTAALYLDARARPARLFPPPNSQSDWTFTPIGRCVYFADREAVRVSEAELRRRNLIP